MARSRAGGPAKFYVLLLVVLTALSSYADSGSITLQSGATDFGVVTVGQSSTTTLTFGFNQDVTVGVYVVTQGYQGMDFVHASSGGGCVPGTHYASSTCTVNVTFTPMYPGLRMGAVVFVDDSGNAVSTIYIKGIGEGALPALPTSVSSTGFSFRLTGAVAVDSAGATFVGGVQSNGYVGVWPGTGSSGSVADGLFYANSLAMDGAGNLYVLDWSSPVCGVWKISPAWANRSTTCHWFADPTVDLGSALAVDGAGNVFIADENWASVLKIAPDRTQTTVASSFVYVAAIAVDAAGDLYVADWGRTCVPTLHTYNCTGSNQVWKLSGGAKTSVWESPSQTFGGLRSLATDGAGNLYILDGARLWKLAPGAAAQSIDLENQGLADWNPREIAIDGPGNAYVTDVSSDALYKLSGINSFAVLPPAVDGICGSANDQTLNTAPSASADLCSSGTASDVIGSGPWKWSCLGLHGGATRSCSANASPTPVDGICGPANGGTLNAPPAQSQRCTAGTSTELIGAGPWIWSCTGVNGGAAASCSASVSASDPVDGVCSLADGLSFTQKPSGDLCFAGTASAVTGSTFEGPWTWTCDGLRGGATASCSARDSKHACGPGTFETLGGGTNPITGVAVDAAGTAYWSSCALRDTDRGAEYGPYNNAIATSLGTLLDKQWIGIWTVAGNHNVYYSMDGMLSYKLGTNPAITDYSCSLYSDYLPAADTLGNVYSIRNGEIVYDGTGYWHFSTPAVIYAKHPNAGQSCSTTTAVGGNPVGCEQQTDEFGNGCPATNAKLVYPGALAVDQADNLFIYDNTSQPSGDPRTFNHYRCAIRRVDAITHVITSVQLDYSQVGGDCWDGPVPKTMTVGPDGNLYFAFYKRVYKINAATGRMTGIGVPYAVGEYKGIAMDNYGTLYLADNGKTTVTVVKNVAGASANCVALRPSDAECGDANGGTWSSADWAASLSNSQWLCYSGTATAVTGSGPWNWNCRGANYGRTASCSAVRQGGAQQQQNITFPNPGPQTYGVTPFALGGAATSGLPLTYVVTSGAATVSGNVLTITGAGSVTVQATQAGDASWLAADPVSITFYVNPAALSVTANDKTRAYAAVNPQLDGVLTGVVAGDAISVSYSTTANQSSAAGSYPITPALNDPNGRLGNYTVTSTNGTLVITRVSLKVVADDKSMNFGATVPALTVSYNGFVNGDTAAVLTGMPALATTATSTSPAGIYPITVAAGTLVAANYDFIFINGKMTVMVVPTTIRITTTLLSLTHQADGTYLAVMKIANTGNANAVNVMLTSATLGGKIGSPLPQIPGDLGPGANATATLAFPATAGSAGSTVILSCAGTYSGGNFQASLRVRLP